VTPFLPAFSPQPSALASGTPESTGAVRYYIWDHLGTTRVVTDGNGALISTHDYEPFGVEIPPFGDTGNVTDLPSPNSHKFTGHERDQSTGYDYMHARYYGSSIGRFMRPDPVGGNPGNPQSWNLYAYVLGNPVNYNDPTGMVVNLADKKEGDQKLAKIRLETGMTKEEKANIEIDQKTGNLTLKDPNLAATSPQYTKLTEAINSDKTAYIQTVHTDESKKGIAGNKTVTYDEVAKAGGGLTWRNVSTPSSDVDVFISVNGNPYGKVPDKSNSKDFKQWVADPPGLVLQHELFGEGLPFMQGKGGSFTNQVPIDVENEIRRYMKLDERGTLGHE